MLGQEKRDEFRKRNLEKLSDIVNETDILLLEEWTKLKMKEIRGTKSRCIPFDEEQEHISDTCVCCGKPAKHMVVWGIQY